MHSDQNSYLRAVAHRSVYTPGISQNRALLLGILGPCDFPSRWFTLSKETGLAWHDLQIQINPRREDEALPRVPPLLAEAPSVCTKHPIPGPRCVQVSNCQHCTKIWRVRELQNHEHWGRCWEGSFLHTVVGVSEIINCSGRDTGLEGLGSVGSLSSRFLLPEVARS